MQQRGITFTIAMNTGQAVVNKSRSIKIQLKTSVKNIKKIEYASMCLRCYGPKAENTFFPLHIPIPIKKRILPLCSDFYVDNKIESNSKISKINSALKIISYFWGTNNIFAGCRI